MREDDEAVLSTKAYFLSVYSDVAVPQCQSQDPWKHRPIAVAPIRLEESARESLGAEVHAVANEHAHLRCFSRCR